MRKKIMGRWYDVPDEGDATNEPQIVAQQPPGTDQKAQGDGRSTAQQPPAPQAPEGMGGKAESEKKSSGVASNANPSR